MEDFRLRVFVSAARQLNFTKCAHEVHISQPAVSKHINELEKQFGLALFERRGAQLALTREGELLLKHAEVILEQYKTLTYDMSLLSDKIKGELRMGASTTIAQYFLPSILATFKQKFPDIELSLVSGNSTQIEEDLLNHRIDLGMVENGSRSNGLHYESFMPDELVLVSGTRSSYAGMDSISLEQLRQIPLVLRENGSGTLDVIARSLAAHSYRLNQFNIVMQLGSTEAIKSFIQNSDSLAIVSVIAIRKELQDGNLKIIDIDGLEMTRRFAFVSRQGEDDRIVNRCKEYITRHLHNF